MSSKSASFTTLASASAFALVLAFAQPAVAGGLKDTVRDTVGSVTGGLSGGGFGGSKSSSKSGDSSKSASKSSYGGHSSHGKDGKSGGITVKINTNLLGGTNVKANALSKKGLANVKASTGLLDTKAKVGVLNKDGVASAKVSVGSLNTTVKANVLSGHELANLGVSIGGGGKGGHGGNGGNGGNGSGGNGPTVNGGVLGGMNDAEIAALKVRCVDILNRPGRYDRDLVALCSILQQI